MTDDSPARLPGLETRVTVLEVEMRAHLKSSERIHTEHTALIAKLDDRADKSEIAFARLLAKLSIGFSAAVFLANFLAPILLKALGFVAK